MSRFYGSLNGQAKTEATRRGNKNSGVGAHVRGWNVGVKIFARADGEKDLIDVYLTTGSDESGSDIFIGTARQNDYDGGVEFIQD